jgi:hypothetical protein
MTTHYFWGFPNALPQLAAPTGYSAAILGTGISQTLSAIPNATSYTFEIALNPAFTSGFQASTLGTTVKNWTGLLGSTLYYTRVKGGAEGFVDSIYATGQVTTAAASGTAPVLTNLLPNSAAVGANIQIAGTNLTPSPVVRFGSVLATVVSSTSTQLTVTVPAGTTDGQVTVQTAQGTSNGKLFTLPTAANYVPVNILAVGNSIVEGTGGVRATDKIKSYLPASWTLTNRGHGGWGISLMTKNATAATRAAAGGPDVSAFTADVEPYYNPSAGMNILLIQEGSNEIADYDNKIKAYIAARKAEGWKVLLAASAVRTDAQGTASWLQFTKAMNSLIRNSTFPGVYGDDFVDFERVTKISRYGSLTDPTDPAHASNNPAWCYDQVHWTDLVDKAAGQLYWDYINKLVFGVPLPTDVVNYPTDEPLPGEAIVWENVVNATDSNGDFQANAGASQFGAGGRSTQKILLRDGFCGAFQAEQLSPQSGFQGFGVPGTLPPSFAGIKEGFLVSSVRSEGVEVLNGLGVITGDILRVELYGPDASDAAAPNGKVIWKKNGSEVFRRNTPTTFPAQVYMSFNASGFAGIRNARIEGNIQTAPPEADQGEVMALVNQSATVLSPTGQLSSSAGGFGGSANSAKTITGGTGLRGFFQFTADNNQPNGSFMGSAPSNTSFTGLTHAIFANNGNFVVYESGTDRGSKGSYAAGDKLRVELYGTGSEGLPNGGAKYYKNGDLLYTSTVAPVFPLLVDFAVSSGNLLSNLRIGGPGLSA